MSQPLLFFSPTLSSWGNPWIQLGLDPGTKLQGLCQLQFSFPTPHLSSGGFCFWDLLRWFSIYISFSLSLQFGGTALCSLTSFLVDLRRIVFIIFSAVFSNLLGHNSNFQESLHVRVENWGRNIFPKMWSGDRSLTGQIPFSALVSPQPALPSISRVS